MDYRTIVVHLDSGAHCVERIAVAARLAREFGAHLVGLYAAEPRELPASIRSKGDLARALEWRRSYEERAHEVTRRFRDETSRAGLAGTEVRIAEKDPAEAMALNALYADLAIIGQRDPDEDSDALGLPHDFVDSTLQQSSRPLLVVPYAGSFPRIGSRVLIAWNASRTAARAVRDALPFLRRAEKVLVLSVNPERSGNHGESPGADIALYLARHGVNVEAAESHAGDVEPGSWLVSRACDLSADLIVMGGYGHSRLAESLFGGVTRSILGQLTLPMLAEH
jgi:nucleotide-binding universal stress UspA family protein